MLIRPEPVDWTDLAATVASWVFLVVVAYLFLRILYRHQYGKDELP